jgi:hypothetical protein
VKNGLGGGAAVDKTGRTHDQQGTDDMAADHANPEAGKMDYPVHERNYSGFIRLLKISTVITAIVAAVVIFIIAN